MSSRFRLPLDVPHLGQRIVEQATRVKLDLLRFKDSDRDKHVWCDYEVHGCIRLANDDGDGLAIVQQLLREMLIGKPPDDANLDLDDLEGGCCNE